MSVRPPSRKSEAAQVLDHRILVFTGGIASGKTTIKQAFIRLLHEAGVETYEISGIRDLYLPFAQHHGLIPTKDTYTRQETTALMKQLYARHGQRLGSHLLRDFLAQKPLTPVYILDSKRNPEGIEEVRKFARRAIVIGVHASRKDRLARVKTRKRAFDAHLRTDAEILASFEEEERLFSITKSLAIADELFVNDVWLPNELELRIVDVLDRHGLVDHLHIKRWVSPPESHSSSRRKLQPRDLSRLLKTFAHTIPTKTVFVVQGGNRYLAAHLQARQGLECLSLKLLCASKVPYAVILNTVLDDRDKLQRLNTTQQKTIKKRLSTYPKTSLRLLKKACQTYSTSADLDTVLNTETISVLLQIFGHETIKTPFEYPFDDTRLSEEFEHTRACLEHDRIDLPNLAILQIILSRTELRARLQKEAKQLVFLDDVFYRGRTLFTIASLLKAFRISRHGLKLYTLCADPASTRLTSKHLAILDRHSVYPFENSIKTENGYWQEKNGSFTFIDLSIYRGWLEYTVSKRAAAPLYREWRTKLARLAAKLPDPGVPKEELLALIWLIVYHRRHHLPLPVQSIIDQRGKNLGVCIPFARFVHSFISQEEPAAKRWAFKDQIKRLIEELSKRRYAQDLADLTEYYEAHTSALDYAGFID